MRELSGSLGELAAIFLRLGLTVLFGASAAAIGRGQQLRLFWAWYELRDEAAVQRDRRS